jgi:hypothetical protein
MIQYTMTDIQEDNQKHLNRFKYIPPSASYIAVFIDGDGCIFIRKIVDGYQSGFTITQCRTNILQIIRYHFGGSITSSSNRNDKSINIMDDDNYYYKYNIRNQYNLIIRSNEYQILLDYLYNSFIIKERQYQCLYNFNKLTNLPNKNKEKKELYLTCSDYNKKCNLDEIYFNRLNIEYIAGLFDAEGYIYINKNKLMYYYISISQKNHISILNEIIKFLGFGKIDNYSFIIYKKNDCLNFIKLVKEYLIVKYNQVNAFETFLITNENDKHIKQKMYEICNKEKHEIEIFNELNQNDIGKEGYFEMLKFKELNKQICKEINIKQIYREKSEKMKGKGNHNYGKTFSEETKRKMSLSIRNSKGSVTDETIETVRKLIEDGYKNIQIQELLNLSRDTVSKIKNGKLVCRYEEKKEHKSLSQEELNLSKRKISANDIIFIIEKYIEKYKPSQILNDFLKKNKTNVTIDIIKNIKRNLINNKRILYESELSNDKYVYYMNLRKHFTENNV